MEYLLKKTIHHALQNYLQPLSFIGTAYYLGRRYENLTPFLVNGTITSVGIFAARKFGASCIFGKIAVIGTTRFVLNSVSKKFDHTVTLDNKDEAATLALFQTILALIFSGADAYYEKAVWRPHYRK